MEPYHLSFSCWSVQALGPWQSDNPRVISKAQKLTPVLLATITQEQSRLLNWAAYPNHILPAH